MLTMEGAFVIIINMICIKGILSTRIGVERGITPVERGWAGCWRRFKSLASQGEKA